MANFGTARLLSSVLEFVGWLIIALSFLAFFILNSEADIAIALAVSASSCVSGLLIVAAAQLIRAQIVTAESSVRSEQHLSKILSTLQKQASEAPPRTRQIEATSTVPSQNRRPGPAPYVQGTEVEGRGKFIREAFGHQIFKKDGAYEVDGHSYPNLGQAETYARRNPR